MDKKIKEEKSFQPSIYQERIFDFIENGFGNAVVSAVAGSGKTTTILKALDLIPKNLEVLYLAFNKDIVNSIKKKYNSIENVDFSTVHGYGMSVLKNDNPSVKIDNYKYSNLLRSIHCYIENENEEYISDYNLNDKQIKSLKKFKLKKKLSEEDDKYSFQKRIVELCNYSRIMLVDDEKKLKQIAADYDVDYRNGEVEMALELVKLGQHLRGVVDYTDMLYFPIIFDMHCKKYDWVFIDECQDLNTAQRTLMLKSVKENTGRWVGVGDSKQAIYGFNGADFESFKKLIKLDNTIELPLSVCYRCDKNIIDLAKTLVKEIEFFDKNGIGIVNENSTVNEIVDGDMVLCRNTYPLVKLCFEYLKKGIKATIKGRDIGKSLIDMVQKSQTNDISKLFDFVYAELEKTKSKIIKTHNLIEEQVEENEQYIKQKENIEIIELLGSQSEDCNDIVSKLKTMFSDSETDGIQLSTIHKSKGLECDRVFIIHRDLIPSKLAKNDWQIQQEYNLLYVAYTRAKKYLGFVVDFDAFEDKKKYDKSKSVKEISFSKHVGYPGAHLRVKIKLDSKKLISTKYGDDFLFKFIDDKGNYYTKFGQIPFQLKTQNKELECYVIIKDHTEFNGQKLNQLAKILTVEDYQDCKRKGKNFLYYQRK
jgi:DNA helicase-2/ATP-dependent DNA helicase PcrA